jgi:hypothetical protein
MAIALVNAGHTLPRLEYKMKTMDQMNMYDLATAFIAFGMLFGLVIH